MIRDITALLESEQVARHRALDADQLKDEFLALLSHELRTPLGAILVWLGLLRQGGSDPDEAARALEIIERSARTLERIIEDLLHASRIAAGGLMLTPQLVDLRGVVQVAIDAASRDAAIKGVALSSSPGATPTWVTGDPGRLQQALSNLLSNAIKFSQAGGRVEVSLDTTEKQARLRVVDDGEGMSAAFLPFAFERFRQQDSSSTRAHHGLGLGLYVVRHVVGHHGGVVSAESPGEGRGSTFTVLLPLAAAPGEGARPAAAVPPGEKEGSLQEGLTVLLVDDEEDAREALRRILQQNGMLVTTAASAREACELVESLQPDILLSDIAMPGEDGLSLIRRVRHAAARARWPGPGDRALGVRGRGRPPSGAPGRIPASHLEAGGAGSPARGHRDDGREERTRERSPIGLAMDTIPAPVVAPQTAAATPPRALVVDDDPGLMLGLAELVRREGFLVSTAGSLKEAREAIAGEPARHPARRPSAARRQRPRPAGRLRAGRGPRAHPDHGQRERRDRRGGPAAGRHRLPDEARRLRPRQDGPGQRHAHAGDEAARSARCAASCASWAASAR